MNQAASEKQEIFIPAYAMLNGEKVIEKNENSIIVEFSVPDTNPYFDGHFPGFPILPAVAQTELAVRFASKYLGTGIDIHEIQRIKFTNLIRPFTPVVLKLEKKEETLSFKMYSPDGGSVYSAGILKIRKNIIPQEDVSVKETF